MRLYQLILTNNACYKEKRTIVPRGIMVHSTGANNPQIGRYVGPDDGRLGPNKYNNHWNNPDGRRVCVHAFIGKLKDGSVQTYQTLPWNHRAWHQAGSANDTHISFEICEDGLKDGSYLNEVYKEAVELCAYLCKMYPTIEISNIIGHYEGYQRRIANNHGDPRHWFSKFGKSMDGFRADVSALLKSNNYPTAPIVKLRILTEDNAKFYNTPINSLIELPMQDYLMGVVPAEVGNSHVEACKAQAIASRSIATYWMNAVGEITDVSSKNQAYRADLAKDKRYANAFKAVEETEGQILVYDGKVAQTYFADSNGGKMLKPTDHTWKAELPYLVTKPDPWTVASGKPYNGHPVGMSQQGAIWQANNGANHEAILAFYYPGTQIQKPDTVNPIEPAPGKPVEKKPLYQAEVVTRNPLSLNIWTSIGRNKSLRLIPRGDIVNVTEEISSQWAMVEYKGTVGFVDRQYLKKVSDKQDNTQDNTQDTKPAPEQKPEEKPSDVLYYAVVRTRFPLSLNLWRDAGKTRSLGKVPNGTKVEVLAEVTHIWTKVRYNGTVGYVDEQYLEKEKRLPERPLYTATVKTRLPLSLNIWKEPRRGISLGKVPKGAEVNVMQEVNSPWVRIIYGSVMGFVDKQYLVKK